MKGLIAGLLREPLFHFVLAGAVLFAGYEFLHRGEARPAAQIEPVHIGEGEINWLSQTFASQWRRPPSQDELNTLVQGLVEEDLMAREALALGLDQNDVIVRRRLGQKLTFLIDDTARVLDPGEDGLRRYYAAHPDRFKSDGRISFSQIFFDPARRAHADADAKTVLVSIASTSAVDANIGDPFLVESEFRDATEETITKLFGAEFATAVFAQKPGQWSGPIKSGYGLHLVRVASVNQGAPEPFEQVRSQVLDEWRSQQERDAKAAYLKTLRDKYGVAVDDSVKALLPAGAVGGKAE